MASSIQVVGDRAAIISDLDLIAFIALTGWHIQSRAKHYQRLRPYTDAWLTSFASYFPGGIDLGLDQIAADPSSRKELVSLLSSLSAEVGSIGDATLTAILREASRPDGVVLEDYRPENCEVAISRIRELVDPAGGA